MRSKTRFFSYIILMLSLLVNLVGASAAHVVNSSDTLLVSEQQSPCSEHQTSNLAQFEHSKERVAGENHDCCDDSEYCSGQCEHCVVISLTLILPVNESSKTERNVSLIQKTSIHHYLSNDPHPLYRPPIS